jgi:DNA-binding Xre family transcriptional regulator
MRTTDKEMTGDPVVLRILELIKNRGKIDKDLLNYLGIPSGSMAKWKYYGGTSYLRYIDQICEYLDTTPNYLFWGKEETEGQLSVAEKEIIRIYRTFDDGRKKCIRDTLKYFSNNEEL